jgi:hypothetical protein
MGEYKKGNTRIVSGEEEAQIKSKQNSEFDPLQSIRSQYRSGEDF